MYSFACLKLDSMAVDINPLSTLAYQMHFHPSRVRIPDCAVLKGRKFEITFQFIIDSA